MQALAERHECEDGNERIEEKEWAAGRHGRIKPGLKDPTASTTRRTPEHTALEPARGAEQLPADVLVAIFSLLSLGQRLHQASLVCKRWCRLVRLSVTSLPPVPELDLDRVLRAFPSVTSFSGQGLPANLALLPTRLVSLTLEAHVADPHTLACLSKACAKLTQLTINSRSPDLVCAVLEACSTTLESLTLQLNFGSSALVRPALPRLRSLTVPSNAVLLSSDWRDEWTQLTRLSCGRIRDGTTPAPSILHVTLSMFQAPFVLPRAPSLTTLEVATDAGASHNSDELEGLHRSLVAAYPDCNSLQLHLYMRYPKRGLGLLAPYLVSLRAVILDSNELTVTYPRLTHVTLEATNSLHMLNTGASLPALTHLTLKLRGTLRPELEHLQSVLANVKRLKCLELDVFVSTLSEREALCSFVRYGRGRLGAGLRLQLRVWPHALEKQFREVPELAPYLGLYLE